MHFFLQKKMSEGVIKYALLFIINDYINIWFQGDKIAFFIDILNDKQQEVQKTLFTSKL